MQYIIEVEVQQMLGLIASPASRSTRTMHLPQNSTIAEFGFDSKEEFDEVCALLTAKQAKFKAWEQ